MNEPVGDHGRLAERGDVLALLRRRRDNCALVAARGGPEFNELAADRRRQLEVLIEEIEAGRHEGEAFDPGGCAPPVLAGPRA